VTAALPARGVRGQSSSSLKCGDDGARCSNVAPGPYAHTDLTDHPSAEGQGPARCAQEVVQDELSRISLHHATLGQASYDCRRPQRSRTYQRAAGVPAAMVAGCPTVPNSVEEKTPDLHGESRARLPHPQNRHTPLHTLAAPRSLDVSRAVRTWRLRTVAPSFRYGVGRAVSLPSRPPHPHTTMPD